MHAEFSIGHFGDERLKKGGFAGAAHGHGRDGLSAPAGRLGSRGAPVRRWLGHDRVTLEEIRADFQARAAGHGGHVLWSKDTTELNFQHHAGKVRGLGAGSATARTSGCSSIRCWRSTPTAAPAWAWSTPSLDPAGGKAAGQGAAVRDREPWRWLDGARAAETALRRAECVTVVADHESDLPLLTRPRRPGGHFLVRAAQDRALVEGGLLMTALDDLPVAGHYGFEVAASRRAGRCR